MLSSKKEGERMSLPKETIDQFLAERHNAVMGTIRKDGSPQLNPLWFYWTGEVFYISTTRRRFKYNHLKRDPTGDALYRRCNRLPNRHCGRACADC